MEKILPCSFQPQSNVLKQKLLEVSEVLHAFSAREETPNRGLKQVKNLHPLYECHREPRTAHSLL